MRSMTDKLNANDDAEVEYLGEFSDIPEEKTEKPHGIFRQIWGYITGTLFMLLIAAAAFGVSYPIISFLMSSKDLQ